MPRALVTGNGSLLVTYDAHLQMRDLYYPYVGMEDHTTFGNLHRTGFFVDGVGLRWLDHPSWTVEAGYEEDTLAGKSIARNMELGLHVTFHDYVHPVHNIILRKCTLKSTDGTRKDVRAFFHHNFYIYGEKQKDTAFYEPYTNTIIHYRGRRYFLIGGETDKPVACHTGIISDPFASILHSRHPVSRCGVSDYTVGKANYRGLEGTWKDAEDGVLSKHPVEQGSVDSTVALHCIVEPPKDTELVLWLCVGKTFNDVIDLQDVLLTETPDRLERNCRNYWKSWVGKLPQSYANVEPDIATLYKRSLLTVRAHVDNRGGIIAAADSDIMIFNKDTYTYVWPRDGAFVCMALDRAGYGEIAKKFYSFCCRVQSKDGYLLHKYNPDGSLGSSWHPWFRDGKPQLPIQEDETALVIYAMWKHFKFMQDFEYLQELFEQFIRKAADFLMKFRDKNTGLPLASYDLWEEHRGVFSYTTACVIAGLHAAAQISNILGHHKHAENYQNAADELRQAFLFHLFDQEKKCFVKKIKQREDGTWEKDNTVDASVAIIALLDVLPPKDPRVISTMEHIENTLTVRTPVGGIARYQNDRYHGVTEPTPEVPGNPWIITTLWIAQWHIMKAKTKADLKPAEEAIRWVNVHKSSTGLFPEQLHPFTGEPLSVSPLTWSHATFIDTVLKLEKKKRELQET